MSARTIQDPPFARFLFDNTASAWIWLLARLYLGWQWLQAGWHKVTDPAWMNGARPCRDSGPVLWRSRSARQAGHHLRLVPGVPPPPAGGRPLHLVRQADRGGRGAGRAWALILGLLTGWFAAFAGAFMNFNFMLAGTASNKPGALHPGHPAAHGLEGRRLLGRGPLAAARPGHSVGPGARAAPSGRAATGARTGGAAACVAEPGPSEAALAPAIASLFRRGQVASRTMP